MADDFEGSGVIALQQGDTNVPIRLRFKPCSASTANDGAIPFASTVQKCTLRLHEYNSTAATTTPVVSVSYSSNNIVAYLTYTTQVAQGLYHLRARVTASINHSTVTAMRKYFDFDRVWIKKDR